MFVECTVNTAYQTLSTPQLRLWAVSAVNINPKKCVWLPLAVEGWSKFPWPDRWSLASVIVYLILLFSFVWMISLLFGKKKKLIAVDTDCFIFLKKSLFCMSWVHSIYPRILRNNNYKKNKIKIIDRFKQTNILIRSWQSSGFRSLPILEVHANWLKPSHALLCCCAWAPSLCCAFLSFSKASHKGWHTW